MSLIKRLEQLFVNSNFMLQAIGFYRLTLCAIFDATSKDKCDFSKLMLYLKIQSIFFINLLKCQMMYCEGHFDI